MKITDRHKQYKITSISQLHQPPKHLFTEHLPLPAFNPTTKHVKNVNTTIENLNNSSTAKKLIIEEIRKIHFNILSCLKPTSQISQGGQ